MASNSFIGCIQSMPTKSITPKIVSAVIHPQIKAFPSLASLFWPNHRLYRIITKRQGEFSLFQFGWCCCCLNCCCCCRCCYSCSCYFCYCCSRYFVQADKLCVPHKQNIWTFVFVLNGREAKYKSLYDFQIKFIFRANEESELVGKQMNVRTNWNEWTNTKMCSIKLMNAFAIIYVQLSTYIYILMLNL